MTKTLQAPQPPTEITLNEEEGAQAEPASADVTLDTLKRLAIESKMSLVQQELEGPTHADYLTFEEFTLFLCQLASYLYDLAARERYDRHKGASLPANVDKKNDENVEKDSSIFLLSTYAKTGSKKPSHMQIALSLQNLLLEMRRQRTLDESHAELQEMDLSVF